MYRLLILTLVTVSCAAAPPPGGYPNGLSEQFNFYFDDDESRIRKRLDSYKEMGVQLLRLHAFSDRLRKKFVYLDVLEDYDFRVKMILYPHPNSHFVDQNGAASKPTFNFWNPHCRRQLEAKNRELINLLKRRPVWQRIDYLIPSMGPAGELTYPPTWTTGLPKQTYWCYDEHAQIDFRKKMRKKYQTVDKANQAWKTSYADWHAVKVEKPGKHPGAYWQDLLTWYRDSKRDFARWQIDSIKSMTTKRVIIYIPGSHYTQAQWQAAVGTAGRRGGAAVMTMLDSAFLVQLATNTDCDLQYTGLSRAESLYISRQAQKRGFKGLIYGENAGEYGPASRPLDLAMIIREAGFAGIDYTASQHLFEKDGITPNHLHRQLADAFELLAGGKAAARWTKSPIELRNELHAVWTYVAEPNQKNGLHAMHNSGALPPIICAGKPTWQIDGGKDSHSYLYFAVQHPEIGMGKSPRIRLIVEYFDAGHGEVELQYDSSDESVNKIPGAPGAFKVHPDKIQLTNSRKWHKSIFRIDDAKLANRCNSRDFRLAVKGKGPFHIHAASIAALQPQ